MASQRDSYRKDPSTLRKEHAIQLVLNHAPCPNINFDWFDYQNKLTTVYTTERTYTIGFDLTETQADYIVSETSPSSDPIRARNFSQGSGCTVRALNLRTGKRHEVKVMKNHKGEFIFDWRFACREARLVRGQEIAFGVYNNYFTNAADGRQWKLEGLFFATV